MLLRLAYLGVTNTLALLRLLPMSDREKDAEILALRHQITVLERQLHGDRVRFTSADRAWLSALLHPLPRTVLIQLRLLVRPETVLRWHRDLIARRYAVRSRNRRPGRPPTVRSIRVLEPVLDRQVRRATPARCHRVTPVTVAVDGMPEPDVPQGYATMITQATTNAECRPLRAPPGKVNVAEFKRHRTSTAGRLSATTRVAGNAGTP